jgi:peptidoglycan/LPS O-acetylase OafA/YrhL
MNRQIGIDDTTSSFMDSLRGVSALLVAIVHTFQIFVLPYFGLGSASHIVTSLLATYAVIVFSS